MDADRLFLGRLAVISLLSMDPRAVGVTVEKSEEAGMAVLRQDCSQDSSSLVYVQSGKTLSESTSSLSLPSGSVGTAEELGWPSFSLFISVCICFCKGKKMGLLLLLCPGN